MAVPLLWCVLSPSVSVLFEASTDDGPSPLSAGMHANAYNVLDPHDSLYPRASTVRLARLLPCLAHR